MFDDPFEILSSLKDFDLTFLGLRFVGALVLTLGALKYIKAKRSPVRTSKQFVVAGIYSFDTMIAKFYPHNWTFWHSLVVFHCL